MVEVCVVGEMKTDRERDMGGKELTRTREK